MEMDLVQDRISAWAENTFTHDARGIALHTVREAIELAIAADCSNEEIAGSVKAALKKERNRTKSIDEETADVTILALAMAGYIGFDLSMAVEAKHAVNIVRTWGKPDAQGITEHVEGEAQP